MTFTLGLGIYAGGGALTAMTIAGLSAYRQAMGKECPLDEVFGLITVLWPIVVPVGLVLWTGQSIGKRVARRAIARQVAAEEHRRLVDMPVAELIRRAEGKGTRPRNDEGP